MNVVLLSSDLLVLSRVEAAGARAGIDVHSASSSAQAADKCVAESAELLIVDLSSPQLDVDGVVREIKSRENSVTRIVAFGPHVHEERLNAAHQAGCDEVVSRGQFFSQLDAMFSRFLAQ